MIKLTDAERERARALILRAEKGEGRRDTWLVWAYTQELIQKHCPPHTTPVAAYIKPSRTFAHGLGCGCLDCHEDRKAGRQ